MLDWFHLYEDLLHAKCISVLLLLLLLLSLLLLLLLLLLLSFCHLF